MESSKHFSEGCKFWSCKSNSGEGCKISKAYASSRNRSIKMWPAHPVLSGLTEAPSIECAYVLNQFSMERVQKVHQCIMQH